MTWKGENFDELKDHLDQHINEINSTVKSNAKGSVGNGLNSNKGNSETKMDVNDRNETNKTGAVSINENTSSYSKNTSDKRKTEALKRQDAIEERTNLHKLQKEGNEDSDQTKSKACNIL